MEKSKNGKRYDMSHETRKEMKSRARKVAVHHLPFLIVLCLVAAIFGTTYSQNVSFLMGNSTENDKLALTTTTLTADDVFSSIVESGLSDGKNLSDQLQAVVSADENSKVFGHSRGELAKVVNAMSSGQLYVWLAQGIFNIVQSDELTSVIFILGALLLYILVWVFFKNVFDVILRRVFLEVRTYEKVPFYRMLYLKGRHAWRKTGINMLMYDIRILLWNLTIVGGAIKAYSYFAYPYILAENPNMKSKDAFLLSRRMMDGHKLECFKLDLTMLGWDLLGGLTLGLSQIFYGSPYKTCVQTEYYARIRQDAIARKIPGFEALNDRYLYAKAGEEELLNVYRKEAAVDKFTETHEVEMTKVQRFFARNFGIWLGTAKKKKFYDKMQSKRNEVARVSDIMDYLVYPERLSPGYIEERRIRADKIDYTRTYSPINLILIFFVTSFVGWIWEVSLHFMQDGTYVNRGTLHGPWLPIYGWGAILMLILLVRARKNILLYVGSSIVVCGVLEYVTSWVLEVTKGQRWWDYTGYFLNLNGRICAEGLIAFAIGGVMLTYLISPVLDAMLNRIRFVIRVVAAAVLIVLFAADNSYSNEHPNTGEGITSYTAYKQ